MDKTLQSFTALRIVGGILSPEFLHKIAGLDAPDQKAADYDLSRSLDIKQEIDRYWLIARDLHTEYKGRRVREGLDKEHITEQWNRRLLQDVLGYKTLTEFNDETIDDRAFPLTHQAHEGAVPLLLVKDFELELDRADERFANENRSRQAPHNLMQEYLNATDRSLWGAVSNGSKFRLLRDNASLTRPAYIEIDLELIFEEELTPDFAAFWLMAHDSRLRPWPEESGKSHRCIIEGWRDQSHEIGERVRADLRKGVTDALRSLGQGFLQHPDNEALRKRLRCESLDEPQASLTENPPPKTTNEATAKAGLSDRHYFEQILRLVYRLLFLFAAEERSLLHPPNTPKEKRAIYEQGYGITRLRDLARRRRNYDHHQDLWQSLRITFRALGQGIDDLGLPALGGLFRYEQSPELESGSGKPGPSTLDSDTLCPDLDNARITNEYLLEAIHKLAFFATESGLVRINYRDMGTEELGSVYESLLELHPQVEVNSLPCRFSFTDDNNDESKTRGSDRKLTGSYYTPPALVSELIKSTLEPVISQTIEENPQDPRTALLQLKIIDPACGSGHFLLEAARRLAVEIARLESQNNTVDENLRRSALREVVQRCIYGVDRNPLAVDLCKVALWMEAVVPGKPLTFLDSHILEGDSLIGVFDREALDQGIPKDAYKDLTGDDKAVCADMRRKNQQARQRDLLDPSDASDSITQTRTINEMPEETPFDIEEKRRFHVAWLKEQEPERLRADLYVSAWFAQKIKDNPDSVPLTQDLHRLDEGERSRRMGVESLANDLAKKHRFFHWYLEFEDIFEKGGFDVMLGNPPWERIKLQEQEFFANRSFKIANARNAAERKRLIDALKKPDAHPAEKKVHQDFILAKRHAEAASLYCRSSGRFPLTGRGDLNTYALFSELFLQALNPNGKSGLIVPTGIAVDDTTKAFFQHIVEERRISSLYDFENRAKIFPGVHRSYKFCLLGLSGTDRPNSKAQFTFYLYRTDQLKDPERRFSLSAKDFELFNPNTKTAPIFRTQKDMELARKIYRNAGGVLWKEGKGSIPEQNPWGVKFSTMFHMSNDSNLFKTRKDMEDEGYLLQGNHFIKDDECWLPLYEAKLFFQYDHRFATFDVSEQEIKKGNPRQMTAREKADPESVILPRYWVDQREVKKRLEKTTGHLENFGIINKFSSEQRTANSEQRTANSEQRTANSEQRTANSEQRTANSRGSSLWSEHRSQKNHSSHRRENRNLEPDSDIGLGRFGNYHQDWLFAFRDVTNATNQRTAVADLIPESAVSGKAPLIAIAINNEPWLHTLSWTEEPIVEQASISNYPFLSKTHSTPVVSQANPRAMASALVMANCNSLPLDWTARLSVGGVSLSLFIAKQLPILPPEAYLNQSNCGLHYAQMVAPRVLELTYTSWELQGFARDLGYEGEPFKWNEERRHCLRSELDAIYAEMYGLNRSDLEHILDAPEPSTSFPTLKKKEIKEFGEYRTKIHVLEAFDQLQRGENPDLESANHQS